MSNKKSKVRIIKQSSRDSAGPITQFIVVQAILRKVSFCEAIIVGSIRNEREGIADTKTTINQVSRLMTFKCPDYFGARILELVSSLGEKRASRDLIDYLRRISRLRADLKRLASAKLLRANAARLKVGKKRSAPSIARHMRAIQALTATQAQIQAEMTLLTIGGTVSCPIWHGVVHTPAELLLLEHPSSNHIENTIDAGEVLTDVENGFSINATSHGEGGVQNFGAVAHRYLLPAAPCDCFAYWLLNEDHIAQSVHQDDTDTQASGGIIPFALAKRTQDGTLGLEEAWANERRDLLRALSFNENGSLFSHGPTRDPANPVPFKLEGRTELVAGEQLNVFTGGILRLVGNAPNPGFFEFGWLGFGDTTASSESGYAVVAPPGTGGSGFDDRPGVQFLMWPKSQMPNCYITTATCTAVGKGDDCEELQVLRHFRDSYVAALPDGKRLIDEYYAQAPYLLHHINSWRDADKFLRFLYGKFIGCCVQDVKCGQFQSALLRYQEMVQFVRASVSRRLSSRYT